MRVKQYQKKENQGAYGVITKGIYKGLTEREVNRLTALRKTKGNSLSGLSAYEAATVEREVKRLKKNKIKYNKRDLAYEINKEIKYRRNRKGREQWLKAKYEKDVANKKSMSLEEYIDEHLEREMRREYRRKMGGDTPAYREGLEKGLDKTERIVDYPTEESQMDHEFNISFGDDGNYKFVGADATDFTEEDMRTMYDAVKSSTDNRVYKVNKRVMLSDGTEVDIYSDGSNPIEIRVVSIGDREKRPGTAKMDDIARAIEEAKYKESLDMMGGPTYNNDEQIQNAIRAKERIDQMKKNKRKKRKKK